MSLDDDIARVLLQEERLVFDRFTPEMAWTLGVWLKDTATARCVSIAVDISLRDRPLYYFAMAGTNPTNPDWIRRKRNVVYHFARSSYGIGLGLDKDGSTVTEKVGLPLRDYATHGGGFPIMIRDTGCIGAIIVSGLPQRDDHNLVVEAIAVLLGVDPAEIALDK